MSKLMSTNFRKRMLGGSDVMRPRLKFPSLGEFPATQNELDKDQFLNKENESAHETW